MPARTGRHLLVLIDANGLVYRAFYALPYFTTSDGQPTNAVYDFTTMLLKVLEEESPEYVAVAFDKPGPTFRHEAYAEYKATRRKMCGEAAVRERFGIAPQQIPDLKSLKGDTTDNIPGVPGVGEKTASRLLGQYGSVEALLNGVGDIREAKLRERLREHREQILT